MQAQGPVNTLLKDAPPGLLKWAFCDYEDLGGEKAIEKIKALVEQAQTCFFCTAVKTRDSIGARPMSVQQVDDEGSLWFLSAEDSHKNQELALDPSVKLYFQGSAHSDFLVLSGNATISHNKAKIKELWEPIKFDHWELVCRRCYTERSWDDESERLQSLERIAEAFEYGFALIFFTWPSM